MRIIAGKYKTIALKSPSTDNIRPTTDKVKQAIFTKLQFFVEDKDVLDLFCGSGALGIEALSRYANSVVFCDKSKDSCNLTKQNLKKINENAKVLNLDYKIALKTLKQKFHLVLLDPPYFKGVYEDALKKLIENNLLYSGAIVVVEYNKTVSVDFSGYEVLDVKNYGTVCVAYLEFADKDESE